MGVRDRQKTRTRKMIIEEATREFLQNGFLNASTKNIARQCGIAHGTIFVHFATKEDIFHVVIGNRLDDLVTQLSSRMRDASDPFRVTLDVLADNEALLGSVLGELPMMPSHLRGTAMLRLAQIQFALTDALPDLSGQARGEVRMWLTSIFHHLALRSLYRGVGGVVEKFRDDWLAIARRLILQSTGGHNEAPAIES